MSKWDRRMLGLVNLIATCSKDPSTGVGAVIVDSKNRIVSVGFNGFPRAVCDSDEALFDRDEKLRRTIHAEENALLFAGRPVEGCTIYVTHPPLPEFRDRGVDEMRSASAMFLEAGVGFEYMGVSE